MPNLKLIIILLVFILAFHILATVNSWYWIFHGIDIPMHILGGAWLAMIFFYFVKPKLQITNKELLIGILLAVAFAGLGGILWEFFEFFLDLFIKKIVSFGWIYKVVPAGPIQLYRDTLKDLLDDLLGGLFFSLFYYFRPKK